MSREKRNAWQREYRKKNGSIHTKVYEKTPSGFLMRLYRNMKSRISGIQKPDKDYWVGKELFDKGAFYEWALNHPKFIELFEEYREQGYPRKLAPSIDRIDSNIGYTFNNVEWVTMLENSIRGTKKRYKYE